MIGSIEEFKEIHHEVEKKQIQKITGRPSILSLKSGPGTSSALGRSMISSGTGCKHSDCSKIVKHSYKKGDDKVLDCYDETENQKLLDEASKKMTVPADNTSQIDIVDRSPQRKQVPLKL